MAVQDGRPSSDIGRDLFKNPRAYSFFQAIRLLRLIMGKTKKEGEDALFYEILRIRPLLSLSFPGTDVYSVDAIPEKDHVRYLITATFLGLYGAASPLPTHYTEDLLDEASDDRTVTRDFLDVVNHPFYRLFYQGWSKYRWPIKLIEENDEDYFERLYCILGLGAEVFRAAVPSSYRLLRYLGLFIQFPRSAMGLRSLLADALNEPNLDVVQGILRNVSIPENQRCLLGLQGITLGENCYVGHEIEDRMGKIRVKAGPLNEEKFRNLLPIGPLYSDVEQLSEIYLNQPLERELELIIRKEDVEHTQLGVANWSALGYDTWLYTTESLEDDGWVVFQLKN
jgi:type VI secretion system protein ImpH